MRLKQPGNLSQLKVGTVGALVNFSRIHFALLNVLNPIIGFTIRLMFLRAIEAAPLQLTESRQRD
jgi:hypothetical protein